MDDRTHGCSRCAKRTKCRSLCHEVSELLRKEERHFQGREVLVCPTTITAIYSSRHPVNLAEMSVERVTLPELRVIPGLTRRQMAVLELAVVELESQRAIAARLGLCQSTVGEHLNAARRKARRYLDARLNGGRQTR